MKKLALLLALTLALTGCSSQTTETATTETTETTTTETAESVALTDITFVLDWTPNTNHTGLYVAIENGYFEANGLNVTVVQPPEDGAEMMVAAGQAQFGVSFQDYMAPALAMETPLPIVAVATILQHNTSGIISLAGNGMDTPAGMAGHTYATWDLPIEQATIEQVVTADGGDFSQIEMIPSTVTDEVSALQSGMVDAIWVYYGWAGIACEVAGLDTDYFHFADIDPVLDFYNPLIISNTDYLETNPDEAKAFISALSQGYEFAVENPDEAAQILMDCNPELADSADLIVASQAYLAGEYVAEASQWGVMDQDRWDAFYAWLWEGNMTESEIPAGAGFTNDYLPAN